MQDSTLLKMPQESSRAQGNFEDAIIPVEFRVILVVIYVRNTRTPADILAPCTMSKCYVPGRYSSTGLQPEPALFPCHLQPRDACCPTCSQHLERTLSVRVQPAKNTKLGCIDGKRVDIHSEVNVELNLRLGKNVILMAGNHIPTVG